MNCSKCGAELRITHGYRAGKGGKTSTGKCPECGTRHTIVSFVLGEVGEDCKGAFAVANSIKRGTGPRIAG